MTQTVSFTISSNSTCYETKFNFWEWVSSVTIILVWLYNNLRGQIQGSQANLKITSTMTCKQSCVTNPIPTSTLIKNYQIIKLFNWTRAIIRLA